MLHLEKSFLTGDSKKPTKRSREHLPSLAIFCSSYCYFLYQSGFPNWFFGLTPDSALIHICEEPLSLARWRQKLFGDFFFTLGC